jgi:hypothetical protein
MGEVAGSASPDVTPASPVILRAPPNLGPAQAALLRTMFIACPSAAVVEGPGDPEVRWSKTVICPGCGRLAGAQDRLGCPRMIGTQVAVLMLPPELRDQLLATLPREVLRREPAEILTR